MLVEGDIDARFLRRFINQNTCFIQNCQNRDNVIKATCALASDNFDGVCGLVDRDFGDMLGENIGNANIIVTIENDLEMILFESEAFDRFIAEYGNPEKISATEAAQRMSLRDYVVYSASVIGSLRCLSRAHGWNLCFEDFKIKYVARHQIVVDVDAQIEHLRGRSNNSTMPKLSDVKQLLAKISEDFPDLLMRSQGHDLCEVIARGIHNVFGRAHVEIGRSGVAVEEVLRAAFSLENFQSSTLFHQLKDWERKSGGYKVFA